MAKDILNDQVQSHNPADETAPRIYITCLAAYNNGIHFGKWINLNQGVEAIRAEIQKMLSNSPITGAEEFAIHGATR